MRPLRAVFIVWLGLSLRPMAAGADGPGLAEIVERFDHLRVGDAVAVSNLRLSAGTFRVRAQVRPGGARPGGRRGRGPLLRGRGGHGVRLGRPGRGGGRALRHEEGIEPEGGEDRARGRAARRVPPAPVARAGVAAAGGRGSARGAARGCVRQGAREVRADAHGAAVARFRPAAVERALGAARLGRARRRQGGSRLRARPGGPSVRGAHPPASERVARFGAAQVPLARRAVAPAHRPRRARPGAAALPPDGRGPRPGRDGRQRREPEGRGNGRSGRGADRRTALRPGQHLVRAVRREPRHALRAREPGDRRRGPRPRLRPPQRRDHRPARRAGARGPSGAPALRDRRRLPRPPRRRQLLGARRVVLVPAAVPRRAGLHLPRRRPRAEAVRALRVGNGGASGVGREGQRPRVADRPAHPVRRRARREVRDAGGGSRRRSRSGSRRTISRTRPRRSSSSRTRPRSSRSTRGSSGPFRSTSSTSSRSTTSATARPRPASCSSRRRPSTR